MRLPSILAVFLISLLVFFLVACSTTVPVRQKFPDVPKALVEKCENLKKVEGDKVAITEMLRVVVQNYGLYYECAAKVEGWQEWYNDQKKIYESIK